MNKKLLSLLMAGTLSLSALPFTALAAAPAIQSVAEPTTFHETITGEELTNVQKNLEAVEATFADGTIDVMADLNNMVSYEADHSAGEGKWFPLVITFDGDITGITSSVLNDEDIDAVSAFGGEEGKSVVLWVKAEADKDVTITFTKGGENTTVQLKVTDNPSLEPVPEAGIEIIAPEEGSDAPVAITGDSIGDGTATPATATEVMDMFANNNATLEIVKPDGATQLTASDTVYSGCKVILSKADGSTEEVTIVIKGTVSTTGLVEGNDLSFFADTFTETNSASELNKLVYDMDSDGEMGGNDLSYFAEVYLAAGNN